MSELSVAACIDAVRSCLCFNLRALTRSVRNVYDRALRDSGLSSGQFALLLALRIHGTITKRDLAGLIHSDRTALTRNLQPLIRRRFVKETPGDDRRTRCVVLTPAGVAAIRRATPLWKKAQADAAALLGGAGMSELLATVHRSLDHIAGRKAPKRRGAAKSRGR